MGVVKRRHSQAARECSQGWETRVRTCPGRPRGTLKPGPGGGPPRGGPGLGQARGGLGGEARRAAARLRVTAPGGGGEMRLLALAAAVLLARAPAPALGKHGGPGGRRLRDPAGGVTGARARGSGLGTRAWRGGTATSGLLSPCAHRRARVCAVPAAVRLPGRGLGRRPHPSLLSRGPIAAQRGSEQTLSKGQALKWKV